MSIVIIIILGGLSALYVLFYFFKTYFYKKYGKNKAAISKALVDFLKE